MILWLSNIQDVIGYVRKHAYPGLLLPLRNCSRKVYELSL